MTAPSAEAAKTGVAFEGPRGMAASRRAIKARDFGPGISERIWMVFIRVSPFNEQRSTHLRRAYPTKFLTPPTAFHRESGTPFFFIETPRFSSGPVRAASPTVYNNPGAPPPRLGDHA